MGRPLYETDADLSREGAVITEASEVWRCDYLKLPISYRLDFAMIRSRKIVGLCEVRCRNVLLNTYSTIHVSVMKRSAAQLLTAQVKVPSLFLIKYQDCMRYIDFAEEPDYISIGGRTRANRRDADDVELVANYSVKRLKQLR